MAKCKACDKGGLFQKVSREGLCAECAPTVGAEIERESNEIYEAMHEFERAPDREQKLRHCDRVIAAAQKLVRWEDKGLETCSPPARLVLTEYQGFREECQRS
jgi:hypothetical protein